MLLHAVASASADVAGPSGRLDTIRRLATVIGRTDGNGAPVVVEGAFDGIRRSRRYEGGVALRVARVRAYRSDGSPAGSYPPESLTELDRRWSGRADA